MHYQPMRLRNNKSIAQNPQDPNGSILDDEIDTSSDEASGSEASRKRKRPIRQGNRSRKRNTNGSATDKSSSKVGNSENSINIVGVTKRKSGKYGVKVHDRIRKKDVWLGTYECAEEATRVYWAKKEELEKEFEALALKVSKTKTKAKRTSEYVGVSRRASGKFAAHIRDPIRKKKLYLGAFESEKEASKVYLAKKAELEKEAKGKEGVRWFTKRECRRATSLDLRKKRKVGDMGQCRKKKSSIRSDHSDSYDGESAPSDSEISSNDEQCFVDDQESPEECDTSHSLSSEDDQQRLVNNQESPKEFDEQCFVDEQESPEECDTAHSLSSENDQQCLVNNQESRKEFDNSHSSNGKGGLSNAGVSKENLPIVEENREDPCSDNQYTLKEEIDQLDSSHKEDSSVGARAEDLAIQNNGAETELIVVDSRVESLVNPGSCSNGEILLRTKSGTPLMDCNGYLLGEWSCIDDLSLSSNL